MSSQLSNVSYLYFTFLLSTPILSCTQPVLHPSCPAPNLSYTQPVLHPTCPATFLSCNLSVLQQTCPAPNLSCTQPALHPTYPAPNLSCTYPVLSQLSCLATILGYCNHPTLHSSCLATILSMYSYCIRDFCYIEYFFLIRIRIK